jgi:hypothetical protein
MLREDSRRGGAPAGELRYIGVGGIKFDSEGSLRGGTRKLVWGKIGLFPLEEVKLVALEGGLVGLYKVALVVAGVMGLVLLFGLVALVDAGLLGRAEFIGVTVLGLERAEFGVGLWGVKGVRGVVRLGLARLVRLVWLELVWGE